MESLLTQPLSNTIFLESATLSGGRERSRLQGRDGLSWGPSREGEASPSGLEAPGEAARSGHPPGVEGHPLTDGRGLSHSPLRNPSPSLLSTDSAVGAGGP